MKVYISGAIASDPDARDKFKDAEQKLLLFGHDPVNPFDIEPDCDGSCVSAVRAKTFSHTAHSWQCHLKHDLILMLMCDAVALLPTWRQSEGARLEAATAQAIDMKVAPLQDYL